MLSFCPFVGADCPFATSSFRSSRHSRWIPLLYVEEQRGFRRAEAGGDEACWGRRGRRRTRSRSTGKETSGRSPLGLLSNLLWTDPLLPHARLVCSIAHDLSKKHAPLLAFPSASSRTSDHRLLACGRRGQPRPLLLRLGLLLELDLLDDLLNLCERQVLRCSTKASKRVQGRGSASVRSARGVFELKSADSRKSKASEESCRRERDKTHLELSKPVHNGNLDVLSSSLDDLEKRLDRQLDRLVPGHVVPVVLLQKLADGL